MPPEPVIVPADGGVPSPQSIVAEKSLSRPSGLASVNFATVPLNGAPAVAVSPVTAVAVRGASAIVAVVVPCEPSSVLALIGSDPNSS